MQILIVFCIALVVIPVMGEVFARIRIARMFKRRLADFYGRDMRRDLRVSPQSRAQALRAERAWYFQHQQPNKGAR